MPPYHTPTLQGRLGGDRYHSRTVQAGRVKAHDRGPIRPQIKPDWSSPYSLSAEPGTA